MAILALFLNSVFVRRAWNCRFGLEKELARPADDPEGRLRKVHVVYSSDRRGIFGVLTSMASLARHLKEPEECEIHFIVTEDMLDDANGVVECFKRELAGQKQPAVTVHKLQPLPFNVSNITYGGGTGAGPIPHSWVRFFLNDYIPLAPRALWLDMDTIVQADVAPLYKMHMEHTVAGVQEIPIYMDGFNSGVLLIDLDRFRKEDRARSLVANYYRLMANTTDFADQNVMNVEFPKGKWDELDWRWNAQGWGTFLDNTSSGWLSIELGRVLYAWQNRVVYNHCWHSIKILHYTMGAKWWTRPSNPPNCHLLRPHVPKHECLGWKFHCESPSTKLE